MIRAALALPLLASLSPTPDGPTPSEPAAAPRLVVLVVVDQMIPEQLERLAPWLSGGLGRFAHRGQVWRRGAHEHGVTQTGPGHATLGTGVHPARHGIVANSWRAPDREVYCCEDPNVQTITSEGTRDTGLRSPALLMAPGLAAYLQAASPDAMTIGIAAKDRAAVLTTGHGAERALWWDRSGTGFISSSYYGETLPEWTMEWNEGWADRFAEEEPMGWTEIATGDAKPLGTQPDSRPGEALLSGSAVFPHLAPKVQAGGPLGPLAGWIYTTPFVDRFVVDMAMLAVDRMGLGDDDAVDALFVGMSACDTVGHRFGPYSREVTDVVLRADRELERLFVQLDERLGPNGWVAALSSDHGVLPLPEHLAEAGYDAHRLNGNDIREPYDAAMDELAGEFGSAYVIESSARGVLLDRAGIAAAGLDAAHFRRRLADAVSTLPWIARAYTREDLLAPDITLDPLAACMARSFIESRSPDVVIVPRPWHLVISWPGTSHGSPYSYDRRVPIAFFGPGISPEERFDACATVDVLPTLLSRAGLPVPDGLDGRVLD